MTFQITYYLGQQKYKTTKFKGTREEARNYVQAYRLKKHLVPREIYLRRTS